MKTLIEIRARLAEIRPDIETLGTAETLTEEDETRLSALIEEHDTLTAAAKPLEERARKIDQIRAAAATPGHTERGDGAGDPLGDTRSIREDGETRKIWDLDAVQRSLSETPSRGGHDLRARALSAVEKAPGLNERSKVKITALLDSLDMQDEEAEGRGARSVAAHIVATSSPEYMRAWAKAFKTGMRFGQPDAESVAILQRAASLTDASGGYAVPLPIDPTLILNDDGAVNPFREISTVKTIVTDQLRSINATAVSASWDAEAAQVSDDTPTWANRDISVHMARAFVPHSIEIGMDYPGFTQDVAMLMAEAKTNLEATAHATGSGSGQPKGIVTALAGTSYEINAAADDTFALADVYTIDDALPSRWADSATWVANKKIYGKIRQAGGANLDDFWVNLRDGRPPLLLGHPTREASAMDGDLTTSGAVSNYVLILGDFRNYWIVDRVGFSVELIPHLFQQTTAGTGQGRPTGQRGVFAFWRTGADSVNDRAFRLLDVASAA